MPDLTFTGASGELGAYVAEPGGDGPWPGVVVVQDLLGLSDDIRRQADRLAGAGYLAFAPDLYSGRGLHCVLATLQAAYTGRGRAYGDLAAARHWLVSRQDCTGKIGIIGFCMGGSFAVQTAPTLEFDVASVNYGEIMRDADTALQGACPIVASYGRRDLILRGRARRLEQALEHLDIAHDVREYPDAGHSFMNHLGVPTAFGPLLSLSRMSYDETSAEDSWKRILAFFATYLRPAA